ncbi:hypothetical protein RRG08_028365 [Elysia crispata]|uniref:Uncharacterized protein n=1 Tax=Elysia crispata TaxID=231223 RepID=A0AAE1E5N2_9GAST|nr:hypothetical protein RRG08_028365 [Elysia crispata]
MSRSRYCRNHRRLRSTFDFQPLFPTDKSTLAPGFSHSSQHQDHNYVYVHVAIETIIVHRNVDGIVLVDSKQRTETMADLKKTISSKGRNSFAKHVKKKNHNNVAEFLNRENQSNLRNSESEENGGGSWITDLKSPLARGRD